MTMMALPRLLAKGWALFNADDDCEFLTSDIGIVKHRGGWDRPVLSGPGWWSNANAWLMPLTPKVALAMAPGLQASGRLAQRAYVDPLNRAVVNHAREFVFGATEATIQRAIGA
jgi:hypothetical protein